MKERLVTMLHFFFWIRFYCHAKNEFSQILPKFFDMLGVSFGQNYEIENSVRANR